MISFLVEEPIVRLAESVKEFHQLFEVCTMNFQLNLVDPDASLL